MSPFLQLECNANEKTPHLFLFDSRVILNLPDKLGVIFVILFVLFLFEFLSISIFFVFVFVFNMRVILYLPDQLSIVANPATALIAGTDQSHLLCRRIHN